MSTVEILTLSEAADLIRVSQKTLGELARRREIPAKKVGREWRFLRNRSGIMAYRTGRLRRS